MELWTSNRRLRIVHVDDEKTVIDMMRLVLPFRLKNLELIQFDSSVTAMDFLTRANPDILITDDAMPRYRGSDIVDMLQQRRATFPILVISAFDGTMNWVKPCAKSGFPIKLLAAPFTIDQLFADFAELLGPL